jgi:hypothetical protein
MIPMNYCRPIIANKKVRKIMKDAEFASSGNERSKIITYLRILGIAFKFLNGLMTLRILSALKFIPYAMNSSILNR